MPNRVIGLRLTQEKLHQLGLNVEVIVGPALLELGKKVADDAASHVHRTGGDTLHLADDIKVGEVERHGNTISIKVGPSKRTAWRAKFLEFGTRLASAHAFLRPARDSNKQAVKDQIRERAAVAAKASGRG
jgi:HK97 gp10 family phage protein